MTRPSYVTTTNRNSGATGSGSNVQLDWITNWTSGLTVVACVWRGTNQAFTATPSGWTQIGQYQIGSTTDYVSVWWKRMGSSEPASYVWSWTTSVWREVVACAFLDCDSTNAVDVAASSGNASSSTTITCAAVTPTVNNTLLVCIAGYDNDTSFSPGGSLTEVLDFGGWAMAMYTINGPSSGVSSGTNTVTAAGGAFPSAGITVALREVQTTGAQTVTPNAVSTGETFFSPSVQLTLLPNTVGTSESVPQPIARLQVLPGAIATGEAVYQPTVTIQQVVTPNAIATGEAVYQPTVSIPSPQTVSPNAIATAAQVFQPVVNTAGGLQTVLPMAIGTGEQVYAPTVNRQVLPATIGTGEQVYGPTVFLAIPQTVSPGTIASAELVPQPLVSGVAPAIRPDAIPSGERVYAPSVVVQSRGVAPVLQPDEPAFAPMLGRGMTVGAPSLTNGARRPAPPLAGVR